MEAKARAAARVISFVLLKISSWIVPPTALLWLEISRATRNGVATTSSAGATAKHLFPHYLDLFVLALGTIIFTIKADSIGMHTLARFLRRLLVIQLVIVAFFFIYLAILLRAYMVIMDTFLILYRCPLHLGANCVGSMLLASARYVIEWINLSVR